MCSGSQAPAAIQILDADRKRAILITDKCTKSFAAWRDKGESFRVDRYQQIAGRCLNLVMSEKSQKTKVKRKKTAIKQEPYGLSDLKHDLKCGFVKLGDIVS